MEQDNENLFSYEKPQDNEKLSVLFVGDELDDEGLEKYLIDNYKTEKIKDINVESILVNNTLYYDFLRAKTVEYDIVIISEKCMRPHTGRAIFELEILPDRWGEDLPELEYYYEAVEGVEEELPFGFVICNGNAGNLFSEYYSGDERCYLFISPYSVNMNQVNKTGEAGDDFGIKVIRALASQ